MSMDAQDFLSRLPPGVTFTPEQLAAILQALRGVNYAPDTPTSQVDQEQLLSTQEVAGWLNVAEKTLRNWRTEGSGPVYRKTGGKVSYQASDIRTWPKEHSYKATGIRAMTTLFGMPDGSWREMSEEVLEHFDDIQAVTEVRIEGSQAAFLSMLATSVHTNSHPIIDELHKLSNSQDSHGWTGAHMMALMESNFGESSFHNAIAHALELGLRFDIPNNEGTTARMMAGPRLAQHFILHDFKGHLDSILSNK